MPPLRRCRLAAATTTISAAIAAAYWMIDVCP